MRSDIGYIRFTLVTPSLKPADTDYNISEIASAISSGSRDTDIFVFPELSVTGYTCGDMFLNEEMLRNAENGLVKIRTALREGQAAIVGCPLRSGSNLFNCAVVITPSEMYAVPKTHLPNYCEFYERRWFDPARYDHCRRLSTYTGIEISPYRQFRLQAGTEQAATLGVEICEDLWAPSSPSERMALAGCDIIVNLSASDALVSKNGYLKSLIGIQSAKLMCGYLYVSSGPGESSTDMVFAGKQIAYENGKCIGAFEDFTFGTIARSFDMDYTLLRQERMKDKTFSASGAGEEDAVTGYINLIDNTAIGDMRRSAAPSGSVFSYHEDNLKEIFRIQSTGLQKRLLSTGIKKSVIGISGGADSTLALLVTYDAYLKLGRPLSDIIAITMPCFGTSSRTKGNALELIKTLGCTARTIDITKSVRQHFADIGHDESRHDVTYENCQARERTQILFDVANQEGGIVIGTGDLSELAMGWCTFGADHLSNYSVNCSVPKTLVKSIIRWYCGISEEKELKDVLSDILDTPISPELLPPNPDGTISQKSEDTVGPYEVVDFFLYYHLRYGFGKRKILFLAEQAFAGKYTSEELEKYLNTFYRRFKTQQFKRSCLPDGPKVGSISLSPRSDWRMPSDL